MVFIGGGFYIDYVSDSERESEKQIVKEESGNLKNVGAAPEFSGISTWLNSNPLTMKDFKGKVVLIDFWTYSCINCIRTLPYVTEWYEKYKDNGFVIVGVHTPEFEFEKVTKNVETAIKRYNITYPVAQDNDFSTWRAYNNRYWPAHYLVDQNGNVVYTHFGEGKYDETENAIRKLFGLDALSSNDFPENRDVRTPEIYFGTNRLDHLSSEQKATAAVSSYELPQSVGANSFALEGNWRFDGESAILESGSGKIRLNYFSKNVHMVAEAKEPITVQIFIDDQFVSELPVSFSQLYTLYEGLGSGNHIIDIVIPEPGFQIFTFTFG